MEVKRLIGDFVPEDLIVVQTSKHYSLPMELSRRSDVLWQDLLERSLEKGNNDLWNGIVYRLDDFKKDSVNSVISMGTMDYKDNLATSCFIDEIEKLPFEKRPNGMHIVGFLKTSDDKFIFGVKTNDNVQRLKPIGGNLNQDEMQINSGSDFFDYFFKELFEETGIDRNYCDTLSGIGLFIMPTTRIALYVLGQLSLTFDQFVEISKPNFEHESFIGFSSRELLASSLVGPGVKQIFGMI